MSDATLQELYDDLEFAQSAKISYEKKRTTLRQQLSEVAFGIRGAQAMIDDITTEIGRRKDS